MRLTLKASRFLSRERPGDWKIAGQSSRVPEIAQGIFNIQLKTTVAAPPGPTYLDLLHPNDDHFCRVHKFRVNHGDIDQSQLATEEIADGTLLTITPTALNEICAGIGSTPAYFRLRAYWSADETSPFVEMIPPADKLLQSGYDEIHYLDFRLNEARTLPTEIENFMRSDANCIVPQTMVAFLTAVPVQLGVTASSVEQHKMRLLEFDLWKNYVPGEIPQGMVVYHWKTIGKDIQDFSAFIKMEARVSSRSVLLIYLLIALLFALFSNLAASVIYEKTDGLWLKPAASATASTPNTTLPPPSAPSIPHSNTPSSAPPTPPQRQDTRQQ